MSNASREGEADGIVQESFAQALGFSDDLYAFGSKLADKPMVGKQSMDAAFYNASASLHVRACRVFRSGVILARKALAAEADVLARTLLETALVQAFVSREAFTLVDSTGAPARVPSSQPDRRLRDRLYLAHSEVRSMDWAAESNGVALSAEALEEVEFWRNQIGDAWLKVIRKCNTPGGVSIAALAKSAGGILGHQFMRSYGYHCGLSHTGMSHRYSEPLTASRRVLVKWNDQKKEIAVCLANLSYYFLLNLEEFMKPYDSGLDGEYRELDDRFIDVFNSLTAIAAADKD